MGWHRRGGWVPYTFTTDPFHRAKSRDIAARQSRPFVRCSAKESPSGAVCVLRARWARWVGLHWLCPAPAGTITLFAGSIGRLYGHIGLTPSGVRGACIGGCSHVGAGCVLEFPSRLVPFVGMKLDSDYSRAVMANFFSPVLFALFHSRAVASVYVSDIIIVQFNIIRVKLCAVGGYDMILMNGSGTRAASKMLTVGQKMVSARTRRKVS
ncbi:hypothetical protein FA95DRAFT_926396 [Auriscalpium vulgare]|uniref:Uncharacterized protein n=1 Tax=Auriscalpium vulgare TaxID=40419 RepID=A0ACB8R7W7_9AGAM|nr:hypothetical protein FA95DRAFT_926396 [Auriscalpium vulgare]